MQRRDFMKTGFAATLGAALAVRANAKSSTSTKKPNFLFIIADDCTYNELGCFGGKNAKTPNIDRIAREGIRFTRAYSAMAMCAPFRAELYTGLYPVKSGVAWNHSKAKPGTRSVCHYLGDLGYRVGLSGKKHANPPEVFPFETLKDFPAGAGIRNFIEKDPGQPFCLFLCSHNTHAPWTTGDASQFDPDKIKLAPVQHDNPSTREVMTRYYAELTDLDREVGQALQLLDETGRTQDTLVFFSSEQGWALGYAKWSNWNLGVHTGLIARWPGHIAPGTETDALVQMADVVPTLVEAAGGDSESLDLDGSSFLKVLTGKANTHRQYVYGVHNNVPEGEPYPIRSLRDGEFHYLLNLKSDAAYHEKHVMAENSRLIWWPSLQEAAEKGDVRAISLMKKYRDRPREELYRVDKDPYEMQNLADDPEYASVKKRLRAELKRWMTGQDDPGAAMDTPEVYAANKQMGPAPKKPVKKAPRKKKGEG
ncbi:MAG: sulfatase-like hydrolase/transferase [Planctomycetes bacterium]|nr:sulfatase-like hydrolase/transferase [Planctomycetota bacterium]